MQEVKSSRNSVLEIFCFSLHEAGFPGAKCQGLSPNWRISSWQGVLLPEIEFNNWTGWNQFIRKNSCETWVLSSALLSAAWLMLGKLLLLPCPPFIWKWKGFETKQDPVGLLVLGTLLCSPPPTSCSQGLASSLQPPGPSLSSKGQLWTVANQGREEMQREGRSNNNIFELFCRTKTPN